MSASREMVFVLLLGTRAVTYGSGKGEFRCPGCGAVRSYEKKRVRRFVTVYFLPLVPREVVGEYVECQTCRATFRLSVLADDASAATLEAEFHAAVKRVMVLMMLADGRIEPREIETLTRVYEKLAKTALTKDDVEREVSAAKAEGRDLYAYLSSVVGRLNDPGKALVLKAAFFVAAADADVDDAETRLLAELASALEMSPSQFKGVFDDLAAT